jgi:hypothetical protein
MNFTEPIEGRARRGERKHVHIANKVELEIGAYLKRSQGAANEGKHESSCNILPEAAAEPLVPLHEIVQFETKARALASEQGVVISIACRIREEDLESVRFSVHWGSYDELPERWNDTEVRSSEVRRVSEERVEIEKKLRVFRKGNYGATVFAWRGEDDERVWQGRPRVDDAVFSIAADSVSLVSKLESVRRQCNSYMRDTVMKRLNSTRTLEQALAGLHTMPVENELSQVVFECSKDDEMLRHSLSRLYAQARKQLREIDDPKVASKAAYVINVLENLGLGEVVLVAPEGPHAVAGGLAHVMIGLLETLSQHGVRVTLISPLYE